MPGRTRYDPLVHRDADSRIKNGVSYWSGSGEQRLDPELAGANRLFHLSAKTLGFPTWAEILGTPFPRPTCPPLLPKGIPLDQARAAFGELYPITTRDSHLLHDPIRTEVHVTVDATFGHVSSTTERLQEQRYRLIPLIRPSIEEPTEVWEVRQEDPKDARKWSRRRLYLALFEDLPEFPDGVLSVAMQVPTRGGGYRFTHLTLYPLDEGRSLARIEEKRRGRIVYAVHR